MVARPLSGTWTFSRRSPASTAASPVLQWLVGRKSLRYLSQRQPPKVWLVETALEETSPSIESLLSLRDVAWELMHPAAYRMLGPNWRPEAKFLLAPFPCSRLSMSAHATRAATWSQQQRRSPTCCTNHRIPGCFHLLTKHFVALRGSGRRQHT